MGSWSCDLLGRDALDLDVAIRVDDLPGKQDHAGSAGRIVGWRECTAGTR
jgi:hypothetical protein